MIFDSHTHLNDDCFDADREELLRGLPKRGISAFTEIGYDLQSSKAAVTLAERLDNAGSPESGDIFLPAAYAAIGFHPDHSGEMRESDMEELRILGKSKKVVAVGEIGLDYYYIDRRTEEEKRDAEQAKQRLRGLYEDFRKRHPESEEISDFLRDWKPTGLEINELGLSQKEFKTLKRLAETADMVYDPVPEIQKASFIRQMELARELRLPIVIHSRDAAKDTYDLLREHKGYENGGIVHCFSYPTEVAEQFVRLGMHLGVGGVLTFPNGRKLKEVAERIPLSAIVLETDCPYMAPVPLRGSRNEPGNLPYVVKEMAEIKGISEEEVIRVTEENAKRVYGI